MLKFQVKHRSILAVVSGAQYLAMLTGDPVMKRLRAAMQHAGVRNTDVAEACGISDQAVSLWFRTGRVSKKNLAIAARLCRVSLDELVTGERHVPEATPQHRTIPIISAVQAGAWSVVDDPYPVGFGDGEIPVEFLPLPVGPAAFGLRVKGDSMREEFRAGDIVIIDPHAQPRSREPVVAKRDEDNEATFKIYYPRGVDDAGHPIIELVPLNNHFPTLVISSKHPGRVIGPMVARIQGRREF